MVSQEMLGDLSDTKQYENEDLEVTSALRILVGGWTNPFEKYMSKWVHLLQIGMKIKNIWNQHLVFEKKWTLPFDCEKGLYHLTNVFVKPFAQKNTFFW